MVKNILIFVFIILGMVVILNFSDHNLKRAVDACLAGSQKLSKSKITDLEKLKNFVKKKLKKIKIRKKSTHELKLELSNNYVGWQR